MESVKVLNRPQPSATFPQQPHQDDCYDGTDLSQVGNHLGALPAARTICIGNLSNRTDHTMASLHLDCKLPGRGIRCGTCAWHPTPLTKDLHAKWSVPRPRVPHAPPRLALLSNWASNASTCSTMMRPYLETLRGLASDRSLRLTSLRSSSSSS